MGLDKRQTGVILGFPSKIQATVELQPQINLFSYSTSLFSFPFSLLVSLPETNNLPHESFFRAPVVRQLIHLLLLFFPIESNTYHQK